MTLTDDKFTKALGQGPTFVIIALLIYLLFTYLSRGLDLVEKALNDGVRVIVINRVEVVIPTEVTVDLSDATALKWVIAAIQASSNGAPADLTNVAPILKSAHPGENKK